MIGNAPRDRKPIIEKTLIAMITPIITQKPERERDAFGFISASK